MFKWFKRLRKGPVIGRIERLEAAVMEQLDSLEKLSYQVGKLNARLYARSKTEALRDQPTDVRPAGDASGPPIEEEQINGAAQDPYQAFLALRMR